MSRDLERLSEEAVRAFNARDIEGLVAPTHPDIVIELFGGFADLMGDRFEGHDGVRRYYTDWFATFETMNIELDEDISVGDRVVSLTTLTATAEGTDQPAVLQSAVVYSFRDGKV